MAISEPGSRRAVLRDQWGKEAHRASGLAALTGLPSSPHGWHSQRWWWAGLQGASPLPALVAAPPSYGSSPGQVQPRESQVHGHELTWALCSAAVWAGGSPDCLGLSVYCPTLRYTAMGALGSMKPNVSWQGGGRCVTGPQGPARGRDAHRWSQL